MSLARTTPTEAARGRTVGRTTTAVGYFALAGAVVAARAAPATGYEVSMYAATPLSFWLLLGVALSIGFVGAFLARSTVHQRFALVLGGLGLFVTVSLPVLRGYAYYGLGDSLSHLGWAREVLRGELGALDLLYPGIHGVALFVHGTAGVQLNRALLLVVLGFIALYLASVPFLVWTLTDDRYAVGFAAASGFMLLPINAVSAHLSAHPSTMAIMFLPFVAAVLVRYMRDPGVTRLTASGALLALTTVAMTLVHPQQAVNLLLVLLALAAVGAIARWRDRPVDRRSIAGQTAFLGIFVAVWSVSHARILEVAGALAQLLVVGGPSTSSEIAQRGGSLSAIGASLLEVFVKLFLVSTVYSALAGALLLALVVGLVHDRATERATQWFGLGFVPAGLLLLLYLGVSFGTMHFRQLGFVMVGATILGALALAHATGGVRDRLPSVVAAPANATVVAGVAVMLVLSLAVVFPSPYIFQPNMHVTQAQFDGYATTFEQTDEDIEVLGIRRGPDRYDDALLGTGDLQGARYRRAHGVPGAVLVADNATETYDGPRYLVVTALDRERELTAYRGLRYPQGSLTNVGAEPGVDQVRDNGEYELYLIEDR